MPNFSRALPLCVLLGAAACGADAGAAPGAPAAPPPAALLPADPADTLSLAERDSIAGRIAFIAERDGNKELYSVLPTGVGELRLTSRAEQDFPGDVLPDGSGLLVISLEGDGPSRVERFWVAGSGPLRPLGPRGALMRSPSWGPGGEWLVYESNTRDGYRDIYRLDRGTGRVRALTSNPEGNFRPVVSPRGDWVVFGSSRDSVSELYRMRPDGSGQERITRTPRDEWGVRWSSDGGLLAFLSDRDGSDRVYLSYPDGREVRRLSEEPVDPHVMEDKPAWAPRGFGVAWVRRTRNEPSRILIRDVTNAFRGEVRARGLGSLDDPAWSPDGRYLAFTLTRGDSVQVYLARADGTRPTRVTHAPGPNWYPVWLADRPAR
ncbi:MAG: PD40 domain-containing protein [Gemmatimonadetes bacterium]|nr:PD40 domain-containing protein [Gemmatimonadota bacterium]